MKNLLKLEFRKIKKQKSFYICTLIMAGLLFLSVSNANELSKSSETAATAADIMVNALNSSSFFLIGGIYIVLLVCDDYEQQTIKNIYARGYSRKQVYLSKLISSWTAVTIMFIIVMLCAFAFGQSYFKAGDIGSPHFIGILASQYAACMANMCLCFLVSAILRKNGSSIAAAIVAPMLVNMLLNFIDSHIKFKNFTTTELWISSFLSELSNLNVTNERLMICLIASLIYIPFFTLIGIFFHKRIEL